MTKASPIPNDPGVKQISATENDGLLESTSTTKALAVPSSPAISTTRLHRSVAIVFLVLLYAAFALLAWTITAILTFRPISGQAHYGAWFPGNLDYGTGGGNVHQFYVQSEKWYHAARVIQSMVTLVTIPLTSVVCSNAAIVFITHHQGERLSLRKVITLADKSWTDPLTYPRIVMSWKRYRSRFLLAAFLLTALGAVLSPLQQILLSTKTIKTPVYSQDINSLLDIPNQWDKGYKTSTGRDINLITTITQNALTSASNTEPQSQLWQGAGFSCSPLDLWDCSLNNTCLTEWQNYFSTACGQGNTLGNMSALFDPFLAELPNGFNTGLIRQFAPRINSSATYESVSVSKWPTGCEQLPGAFFVEYSDGYIQPNITGVTWALQACMPANQTQSPWTSTRARQDFSEKLYLNITGNSISTSGSRFYLVTLDTTAGYFELPNYMNNLAPGPLLDQQPDYLCGSDCEQEGSDRLSPAVYDLNDPPQSHTLLKRSDSATTSSSRPTSSTTSSPSSTSSISDIFSSTISNNTIALEGVFNKGPLLTIALALFGENSFIASHTAFPQAYPAINFTFDPNTGQQIWPINKDVCTGLFPFTALLASPDGSMYSSSFGVLTQSCISNMDGVQSSSGGSAVGAYVGEWVENFDPLGIVGDTGNALERLTNAFTAASFLANQAWLMSNAPLSQRTLTITWDSGADTEVPSISLAGVMIISVLLGLDLSALLALAVYAAFKPKWTGSLDAFALLRMGAALGEEKVPLLVAGRVDKIGVLDHLPGWIGDATEGEGVGQLEIGARMRVDGKRKYGCYEEDKNSHEKNDELSGEEENTSV